MKLNDAKPDPTSDRHAALLNTLNVVIQDAGNLQTQSVRLRLDRAIELRDALAETQQQANERDAYFETAQQMANDREFYHGIVVRIGEMFGVAARTSDDGSIQDSVLALKVPELVGAERARSQELEKERDKWKLIAADDEHATQVADAESAQLREALRKHGRHADSCPLSSAVLGTTQERRCRCGLSALLAAAPSGPATSEKGGEK